MGLFLRENDLLRCWGSLSLDRSSYIISIVKAASKEIGALIKSTIQLYMEYCCMSGLVLLAATWNCQRSYKNGYAGLLVLCLISLLNAWFIVKIYPAKVFSIGITLVDVHLNWLNWFYFLILKRCLLVILIDQIFLPPFLDVTRINMSTVSFLAQLDSGIHCLENALP